MRIALLAMGSHGDVHPFVGIGRALSARGHVVTVAANEVFAPMVKSAGLAFEQLGDAATFRRWIDDPLLWDSLRGPGRVMTGVAETLEPAYAVAERLASGHDKLVGSSLCLAALCASEKLGFPYATAHLAPICVRSRSRLPTMPGGVNLSWLPAGMKSKFWDGADQWFIDPPILPSLNALRRRVGLPEVSRVLDGWWNAPRLTLGLWPEWFAAAEPDAPKQLRLTGFPLYDESDHQMIDERLDAFLKSGDKPIAFTPGSAMKHGRSFFYTAAEACRRLGRRGLLLTRHADQIPDRLPAGVIHVPFAPFGKLLPSVAALVHHGGIGTTAQALRAGVPQLIMPMTHDQPDNADHVRTLGAGTWVHRFRFTPTHVSRTLNRLLTDRQLATTCRAVAARFDQTSPIGQTCTLIEQM
jgi:rhamnosyltransferase subunit B